MPIDAKLFRTIDVITVLTGISLGRCRQSNVDELVNYVTGHPSLPERGSPARHDVAAAIRSQLPSDVQKFGVLDLVNLTIQSNEGQKEDQLRATLSQIIEKRFGKQLVLTPARKYGAPCGHLRLLRSLAERPNA